MPSHELENDSTVGRAIVAITTGYEVMTDVSDTLGPQQSSVDEMAVLQISPLHELMAGLKAPVPVDWSIVPPESLLPAMLMLEASDSEEEEVNVQVDAPLESTASGSEAVRGF